MKIQRVEIRNFRSFVHFDFAVDGRSLYVIGGNGGGKSSLLTAIARASGRDLHFGRADFHDPANPIEIRLVLSELDTQQQGTFAPYVQFGAAGPTLTMEARSVWDPASEEADSEHRYPTHPNAPRSRKEEREAIPIQWIAAGRDAGRMLDLGVPTNLAGALLDIPLLQPGLNIAVADIAAAGARLAGDAAFAQLLTDARVQLDALVPDVENDAFSLDVAATTPTDLLRQLDVIVKYLGEPVAVERQSSGIAQLAVFAFAIILARREPGRILLVDEPEVSLHPQAQRSLMTALRGLDAQLIVATHSPSLLDRADPRRVVRLARIAGGAAIAGPSGLSEADARKLARFTSPQTADAFFARKVVLVEGLSDVLVLEALAERTGRNLDAQGVAIVPVAGAGNFPVHHQLFGPRGLQLAMAGLCDTNEEGIVQAALEADGHAAYMSRADRARAGFFVCQEDLEDELLSAIGDVDVQALIAAQGDTPSFVRFQSQPSNRALGLHEQLLGYLHSRKIEYAPLLADAVDLNRIPAPLADLLAHV